MVFRVTQKGEHRFVSWLCEVGGLFWVFHRECCGLERQVSEGLSPHCAAVDATGHMPGKLGPEAR